MHNFLKFGTKFFFWASDRGNLWSALYGHIIVAQLQIVEIVFRSCNFLYSPAWLKDESVFCYCEVVCTNSSDDKFSDWSSIMGDAES